MEYWLTWVELSWLPRDYTTRRNAALCSVLQRAARPAFILFGFLDSSA